MPVVLDHELPPRPWRQRTTPFAGLTIGLVNNMPDGAVQATERQFVGLLEEAAGSLPIRLKLYTLPGVPRSELMAAISVRASIAASTPYMDEVLDGLIVTGTEPRASRLEDEPYWQDLAESDRLGGASERRRRSGRVWRLTPRSCISMASSAIR